MGVHVRSAIFDDDQDAEEWEEGDNWSQGDPNAFRDADCIVTAMLLGMLYEPLRQKRAVYLMSEGVSDPSEDDEERLDEDSAQAADEDDEVKTAVLQINHAIQGMVQHDHRLRDKHLVKVHYASAKAWAAHQSLRPHADRTSDVAFLTKGSESLSRHINDVAEDWGTTQHKIYRDVRHRWTPHARRARVPGGYRYQYMGQGASTGLHLTPDKLYFGRGYAPVNWRLEFWGSAFSSLAPTHDYSRWFRRGAKNPQMHHEWGAMPTEYEPGAAEHNADGHYFNRMYAARDGRRVRGIDGKGQVHRDHHRLSESSRKIVGYHHGLVQAIYCAKMHDDEGVVAEIAVGHKPRKTASCFASAGFMIANDRWPDAIHLGRSDSWAPIYEETGAAAELSIRCGVAWDRANAAIEQCNESWHAACHSWLELALRNIPEYAINESHRARFKKLRGRVQAYFPQCGEI